MINSPTLPRSIPALLLLLAALPLLAQSPAEVVDKADQFFLSIRRSQNEIPQSTLQSWVRVQQMFGTLDSITRIPNLPPAVEWRARYVHGFGLHVIGLYDLAAEIQMGLLADPPDDEELAHAMIDLAQSYEMMGEFGRASDIRLRSLKRGEGSVSIITYNNLAFGLLKAGRYDETIRYVNLISLDNKDVAHTRLFSARAFGYSGRYDSAEAHLAVACREGDVDGCRMLEDLRVSSSAEQFWSSDRARRTAMWRPDGMLDSAGSLHMVVRASGMGDGKGISRFAISSWFNEIYGLYPDMEIAIFPAYPSQLPPGSLGFRLVGNIPFLTVVMPATVPKAEVTTKLAAYRATIHGPSAWDKAMPIMTRILLGRLGKGKNYIAVVVHTDAHEQIVRSRTPDLTWEVVP